MLWLAFYVVKLEAVHINKNTNMWVYRNLLILTSLTLTEVVVTSRIQINTLQGNLIGGLGRFLCKRVATH